MTAPLVDTLQRTITGFLRQTRMCSKVAGARIRGKRFYCRALIGKSDYNITVNADISVSGNCNDAFGRGRLGSLQHQDLRSVLTGPVAQRFREDLARGRMPIPQCGGRPELAVVPPALANDRRNAYQPPIGIQLETISSCNLRCIGCEWQAALLAQEIAFSIDGCDQASAEKYQAGMSSEAAYDNMRTLVQFLDKAGSTTPIVTWKYVLLNCHQQEDKIKIRRAIAMGPSRRCGPNGVRLYRDPAHRGCVRLLPGSLLEKIGYQKGRQPLGRPPSTGMRTHRLSVI